MSAEPERKFAPEDGVEIVEDQGGRGRGLKATKAFKKGDAVALYSNKQSKFENSFRSAKAFLYFYANEEISCDGLDDSAGMGVLINDFYELKEIKLLGECKTVDGCILWSGKYESERKTSKHINVSFKFLSQMEEFGRKDLGLFACATRDIAKGEDLFAAYGASYWLGAAQFNIAPFVGIPWESRLACVGFVAELLGRFPALGTVCGISVLAFPTNYGPLCVIIRGAKELANLSRDKLLEMSALEWSKAFEIPTLLSGEWAAACKKAGLGKYAGLDADTRGMMFNLLTKGVISPAS